MKTDLLYDQLKDMQNSYLKLLEFGCDIHSSNSYLNFIDEINIFWYANRNLVRIVLATISPDCGCYTFTGASFLDIEDKEHFPFVALGNTHILDDPLFGFAKVFSDISDGASSNMIKKQIEHTINDNIQILREYSDIISILPLMELADTNRDFIQKGSEEAFLSLFQNEKLTIDEYLSSYSSIEEVENGLNESAKESLTFSDKDNMNDDISIRFKKYSSEMKLPFGEETDEATSFYLVLTSLFTQVLDILYMCSEYNIVPYIRYKTTFTYLMQLSSNFLDSSYIQNILMKSVISYILYRTFNKEWVKDIDFTDYYEKLIENDFSNSVFTDIEKQGLTLHNASFEQISNIIKIRFDNLFKALVNE